ncbi:MAG: FIST C-terminal domain-containing protein [Polyangiaceae bacterium]
MYREKLHRLLGVELDSENFYAHAVHFPFGIVMGDHHLLVRIPIALPNDGSISTAGEIPEQSLLSLLRGPELGSRRTIDEVIEQLGGKHASRQLLTWYCAGRRLHMGDATGDELTQLEEHSGAQILGALSLGEIGAFGASSPYFHNGLILCTSLDGA